MAEKEKKVVGGLITKKDIVVSIILSIVTCGIYAIYWFITISEDVNTLTDDHSMSGGVAFLLSLVTCGIFGVYWIYKIGKRLNDFRKSNGEEDVDDAMLILYIVLQLTGFGMVTYALLQDTLNKYAE